MPHKKNPFPRDVVDPFEQFLEEGEGSGRLVTLVETDPIQPEMRGFRPLPNVDRASADQVRLSKKRRGSFGTSRLKGHEA